MAREHEQGGNSGEVAPLAEPGDVPVARAAAPPAEADAEAEIWRRCASDVPARTLLIERYLPYAKAIAARCYARRTHEGVEFEDYLQFGTVGLIESVDRYRPDRGAKFTTFAMPRIRGAILNGVERLTERLQQTAFRRRILAERVATLVPQNASLRHAQGILDELEDIGVGVALGLILEGTGMMLRPEEALPENAYAEIDLRRIHRQLWQMVEHLTDRERDVVQMHYGQGMRFEEIARALKLSKGRISQVHQQAVARLRGLMNAAGSCDVAY